MVAAAEEIRALLECTTLPAGLVDELLGSAPALWLASNAAAVLAGDLVLCHPALQPGEVRARALPFADDAAWRLTVVAPDRRGLLADTAAVLTGHGCCVLSASAGTWPGLNLALHALTLHGALPRPSELQHLGEGLRAIRSVERPSVAFVPAETATVDVVSEDGERWLLHVRAADQLGLLWRICHGLGEMDIGIHAAAIGGESGLADDLFVLDARPDVEVLRGRLTGRAVEGTPSRS